MSRTIQRREFLQFTIAGTAGLTLSSFIARTTAAAGSPLISPGCRRSKVKVARLYVGNPQGLWPTPHLQLEEEARGYQATFDSLQQEVSDVEFVPDQIVTSAEQVRAMQDQLSKVDGILVIHLNIGIMPILTEILSVGRPTMVFAVPYSGHEWAGFGALQQDPLGSQMECLLTSDRKQLAAAIRPFRTMHHLREAKIVNVTERPIGQYQADMRAKFGTEIKHIGLGPVVAAYEAVSDADTQAEAERWITEAAAVAEPSEEDIVKSCRLALAFERLLADEDATVLTADCYGTMWDRTIKLPAYPCLGFSRLNGMGLGGICESDLRCAMTHIIFQGLAGKPGFISDPTVDQSCNAIVLAHCMGTVKMDGPDKPSAPYKLRTVMERQEGVVPQVFMPKGLQATQALLVGTDRLLYFTGEIVDAPDVDRGCRTKITVKIDGDAEKLWKNWSNGLHRSTCLGNITKDMQRFCRFARIELVNEAV